MSQDISDLSNCITIKSDQLNAEDLLGKTMVITVTGVSRGSNDQPLNIHYENDCGRPYKPSLTMRKILLMPNVWGIDGNLWVGRSMQLFNNPETKFGKIKTGGIEISHLTDIPGNFEVSLTVTRGKKKLYKIELLQPRQKPFYNEERFQSELPAMQQAVESGAMTVDQIIGQCETAAQLSEHQLNSIRSFKPLN